MNSGWGGGGGGGGVGLGGGEDKGNRFAPLPRLRFRLLCCCLCQPQHATPLHFFVGCPCMANICIPSSPPFPGPCPQSLLPAPSHIVSRLPLPPGPLPAAPHACPTTCLSRLPACPHMQYLHARRAARVDLSAHGAKPQGAAPPSQDEGHPHHVCGLAASAIRPE